MRPLQDIIIISKIDRSNGIVLPDGVEMDSETFKVLDCGPGHWEFNRFVEMPLKKGDIIYFVGKVAKFKDGEKEFLFARARDVIAVL